MTIKRKIKNLLALIFPTFSDKNVEYWDKAARRNPYAAICTDHSEIEFEKNTDSIIFDPQARIQLSPFLFRVLDLGCGLGRVAPRLAPLVGQYIGVDFSIRMIVQARHRHQTISNVLFLINDGKTIPLPNKAVDIVFCELAFQHMTKDTIRSYVEEVYRVLNLGGLFLAQVPRMDFYHDKRFAFTVSEAEELFNKYENICLPYGEAYFLVRALKTEET